MEVHLQQKAVPYHTNANWVKSSLTLKKIQLSQYKLAELYTPTMVERIHLLGRGTTSLSTFVRLESQRMKSTAT